MLNIITKSYAKGNCGCYGASDVELLSKGKAASAARTERAELAEIKMKYLLKEWIIEQQSNDK